MNCKIAPICDQNLWEWFTKMCQFIFRYIKEYALYVITHSGKFRAICENDKTDLLLRGILVTMNWSPILIYVYFTYITLTKG